MATKKTWRMLHCWPQSVAPRKHHHHHQQQRKKQQQRQCDLRCCSSCPPPGVKRRRWTLKRYVSLGERKRSRVKETRSKEKQSETTRQSTSTRLACRRPRRGSGLRSTRASAHTHTSLFQTANDYGKREKRKKDLRGGRGGRRRRLGSCGENLGGWVAGIKKKQNEGGETGGSASLQGERGDA